MKRIAMAAFVAAALLAAPAQAGIGDAPPAGTKHLYSVPGVINNGLVTVISCTSTSASTTQTVTVEWFRKDGTSLGNNAASLAPGATANFATATSFFLPTLDGLMPLNETLKTGSARVISTLSKGVVCNAFAMDPNVDPPAQLLQLTITGPKKQKL